MSDVRNLYFINSSGDYELLYRHLREKDVFTVIQQFLCEHNFKSYYIRVWNVPEGTMYDVGSHSEFFLWGFRE